MDKNSGEKARGYVSRQNSKQGNLQEYKNKYLNEAKILFSGRRYYMKTRQKVLSFKIIFGFLCYIVVGNYKSIESK